MVRDVQVRGCKRSVGNNQRAGRIHDRVALPQNPFYRFSLKEEHKLEIKGILKITPAIFPALIIFIMASPFLRAQTPKSENEIPLFPGFVRDMNQESTLKSQMGWENNSNLRSASVKAYKSGASPEELWSFYLQKIGGKEGGLDFDPQTVQRGSASPVSYELDFYTTEELSDYEIEGGKHQGEWMKQNLKQARKPHSSGNWIKEARFTWLKRENNDDPTTFYVIIQDNSFESPNKYATASIIQIQVTTEKSEQGARADADIQADQKRKELSKSLAGSPPTAKELGVPIYPGSKFDAENSAGMSSGNDHAIYIYLSADSPSKVAAFYEQQLKKKPEALGGDQFMFPLKGSMPVPDEGISIQPNTMFGGSAKTVISIQKIVKNGD